MQTAEIAQKFTSAGWNEKAAYEIAEAINGNAALKAEFEEFKLQLDKKISRDDYKNDLDEIKTYLKDFIDTKLTAERKIIEARFENVATKADTDRQFTRIETKMDTNQKWIVGLMIAILIAVLSIGVPLVINTTKPSPPATIQTQP